MGNTWEQEVRAREEENRLAFLAADIVTLDRLWTEDFLVNSPINEVNDKRRTLALLETGRIRHTTMAVEIERRFTNLWRIEGGEWRCFARHANVVRRESTT